MFSSDIEVTAKVGLHARPAALLTQTASKFKANIFLSSRGRRVNAKSLLGVLSLGISCGDTINIIGEGADERLAVNTIISLIKSDFAE